MLRVALVTRKLQDLLHEDGRTVLFVTNDFPPRHGGIETFVRQLCDEIPAERVLVYAPHHSESGEYDQQQPFRVIRDRRATLLPTPGLAARVRRVVERHGVTQVVYGSSVPLGVLARGLGKAGIRRQVAVSHGHEVWWSSLPGPRGVLRHVVDHVDVFTYVSDFTGRRIARGLGASRRHKMTKMSPDPGGQFRPGVDGTAVREQWGLPPSAPLALCVARLVRRKGQDRLIRIWPDVVQEFPDARLVLVGSGPDEKRLRRMVHRRRLKAHVVFAGAVDTVLPYYGAADVFAMPVRSRWWGLEVEGLGISYLEAAACGLRIVGGTSGGAVEAIAMSTNGWSTLAE